VLVGINLLREGLDMPEVSLVAILDADQEGFLRSDRSLIQTVGRAARNVEGRAIFYADRVTGSMQRCLDETSRRRELQTRFNVEHGITPRGVQKSVDQVRFITRVADAREEREEQEEARGRGRGGRGERRTPAGGAKKVAEASASYEATDPVALVARLEAEMKEAAKALDFEQAARVRDQLFEVRTKFGAQLAKAAAAANPAPPPGSAPSLTAAHAAGAGASGGAVRAPQAASKPAKGKAKGGLSALRAERPK
jgi:excinuclease ABC subunit B